MAVSDRNDSLQPRYEGPWGEAWRRQTEEIRGVPTDYYLWAWENPKPDVTVDAVEIAPRGPRFIIAAATLGQVDEQPFVREGKRETRIVVTRREDAEKPFDLHFEVDRGTASYAQPLLGESPEEFTSEPFKGWGQRPNTSSSPAYVEIAAVPSATVTVRRGGEELGRVRWVDILEKGVASDRAVRAESLYRGRNWVRVTVLDDETGRPVQCRVHFRSPEGVPYQPHGHHNHVNSNLGTWHIDVGSDIRLGQITYAYIDGTCQGWLPREM